MRDAVHRATHDEGCSCLLQERIAIWRSNLNIEDHTPALTDLLARVDQLEAALDEVGNALEIILGLDDGERDEWIRDGLKPVFDLAVQTFENVKVRDE